MILRPVAPPVEYGITKRLARAGNAAIAFLRSLGTSAHVWLPGANGVNVASLASENYLLSDGSTGYSTVDGVDGLVKDAMDPVTGINLTQATTANKPLVRRGMYNYALQSNAFGNASWQKSRCDVVEGNAVAPDGTLTADTLTCNASNSNGAYATTNAAITVPSGTATTTLAFVVKAWSQSWCALQHYDAVANGVTQWFNLSTGAVGSAVTFGTGWSKASASMAAVGNGYYLVAFSANVTGTTDKIYIYQAVPSDTTYPCTLGDVTYIHSGAMFTGTWTAAQILAEGGIPTTTTTAASNPSAGKYWWSFDGSNDSLLSGNLGITNACTIVIAGRVNSLAATQIVFAEDTNGVQVSIATDGSVSLTKVGGAALVTTAAGVVVAGVPLVLTARLSAGTADIRKNGAQSATAASALTFSATTGARIGTAFNGTTSPTGGALGWVVPLSYALTDAECLTVERLVSSQFPNGPVF